MSPNRVFDTALDVVRNDEQVKHRYGEPIKGYGRDHGGHREGRRNFIEWVNALQIYLFCCRWFFRSSIHSHLPEWINEPTNVNSFHYFERHTERVDKEDGSNRTRVRFNIEGPYGNAFVFAEVSSAMPSGEFVYGKLLYHFYQLDKGKKRNNVQTWLGC
jgi:mitochondrial import inner membrane translocase subunit TIM21